MAHNAAPDDPQLAEFINHISRAMNIAEDRVANPRRQAVPYLLGAIQQMGDRRRLDTTMIFTPPRQKSPPREESPPLLVQKMANFFKNKVEELCPQKKKRSEGKGTSPTRDIRGRDAAPNVPRAPVCSGAGSSSSTLTDDHHPSNTLPCHTGVPSSATQSRRGAPTVTLDDNSRLRLRPTR